MQSLATWPRRSNALILPARYHDRKPSPAKDPGREDVHEQKLLPVCFSESQEVTHVHELWPLGKHLCPSLITAGSPWHMTCVVMLLNF